MKVGADLTDDIRRAAIFREEIGWDNFLVSRMFYLKVLFSSFPKNGQTAWFDPQTKKLEPHCITKQTAPHESTVQ